MHQKYIESTCVYLPRLLPYLDYLCSVDRSLFHLFPRVSQRQSAAHVVATEATE